jgi:hypothetical protein
MKRNNKIASLCPASSLGANGETTVKQSSSGSGALEDHRTLMTRGELMFYLRDVHRYWSTPRISDPEMEALEQQNLIERRTTGICAIRLTEQGARVKNSKAVPGLKNSESPR